MFIVSEIVKILEGEPAGALAPCSRNWEREPHHHNHASGAYSRGRRVGKRVSQMTLRRDGSKQSFGGHLRLTIRERVLLMFSHHGYFGGLELGTD
jgi:hypothetical protein